MLRQDSIKKILKIQRDDNTDVNIKNIPLRLEIRRGSSVVKAMTNLEWNDSIETNDTDSPKELRILDDDLSFLLIVSNEEINTYVEGQYTVNAFYIENDSDFFDGTRMRYAELGYIINIGINDYSVSSSDLKTESNNDIGGIVTLVASNTNSANLSIPAQSTLILFDELILHDNLIL